MNKTKSAVFAREQFIKGAAAAGFRTAAVYRPKIRDYIIRKLADRRYQEKQVDTSVVALLVRYAITQPENFHAVITGDSDILPAISVAYPEFTRNVFLVSTHPDELNAAHRQTSFSYLDFSFDIEPFFLQNKENVEKILTGEYVHRCEECGRVFRIQGPLPRRARPRCAEHRRGG